MARLLACTQCICNFADIRQKSGVVCLLTHVTPASSGMIPLRLTHGIQCRCPSGAWRL